MNCSCQLHLLGRKADGRASPIAPVSPAFCLPPQRHSLAHAPARTRVRVGMTCWRRLRDWQRAGVWDLIHFALLDWLARYDQIDWARAVVDSCSIRAVHGGDQTGPNPTDRAKRGSKRHLICDGRGVPLAVRLTGANRNDSQEALALGRCDSPTARRTGPTATAARLCARRSRLRRSRHSAWLAGAAYRAVGRDAPHHAREWAGPVALGRRADLCLAESIPSPPRSP